MVPPNLKKNNNTGGWVPHASYVRTAIEKNICHPLGCEKIKKIRKQTTIKKRATPHFLATKHASADFAPKGQHAKDAHARTPTHAHTNTPRTNLVAEGRGCGEERLVQEPVLDEAHDGGEKHDVVGLVKHLQARRGEGLENLLHVGDGPARGDVPQQLQGDHQGLRVRVLRVGFTRGFVEGETRETTEHARVCLVC